MRQKLVYARVDAHQGLDGHLGDPEALPGTRHLNADLVLVGKVNHADGRAGRPVADDAPFSIWPRLDESAVLGIARHGLVADTGLGDIALAEKLVEKLCILGSDDLAQLEIIPVLHRAASCGFF